MKNDITSKKLCKVVYFDEESVTDYIQIAAGGKLDRTTELLNQTNKSGSADGAAKAGAGFGGVLKALIGFETSVSASTSLEASFDTNKMAKNILKNTVLTDFIDILDKYNNDKKDTNNDIHKFTGYNIWTPKDSLSYVALISPYLSMLRSGTGIPAGDFNIAIDKLDNTIKSAKGYYEFVGTKDEENAIFRFNIKAFKNNYKATDLLKMDICIYAVKVGKCSIDQLNLNHELDLDPLSTLKDNPTYCNKSKTDHTIIPNSDKLLDVFDVLLSGVESDD